MKKTTVIIFALLFVVGTAAFLIFKKERWADDKKAPELYYKALEESSKDDIKGASKKLETLIKRYKSTIWQKRWNFLLAYHELEAGQAADAFDHFNRSYAGSDLLHCYSLYYGARAALGSGNRSEAERRLLELLQKCRSGSFFQDSLFLIADSRIESGDYAGAREVLMSHRAQIEESGMPLLQLKLASILSKEGKDREARVSYKEIYCLFPLSSEAESAEACLGLGQNNTSGWDVIDIPLLMKRGEILEDAGLLESALDLYTHAGRLLPVEASRAEIDLRIGRILFGRKKFREATTHLSRARKSRAHAAEADFYIARIDFRKGRNHAFVREMKRLSQNEKGEDIGQRAALMLAEYYDSRGEWWDALPCYASYLSHDLSVEKRQKAQWRVACILFLQGRYQDSIRQFRNIIAQKDNPYFIPASFWTARCLEELKQHSQADKLYLELSAKALRNYYGIKAKQRLTPSSLRLFSTAKDKATADGAKIHPALQTDLDIAEELLCMNLKDLAFEHLKNACLERGADTGMMLMRSAEMALQHGEKQRAIEFLGTAASLPSDLSLSDDLLKLIYPREAADEVCTTARSFSLDCNLVLSMILQESGFNPLVISRAGAIGLMQIMPATGSEIARNLGKKGHKESMLFESDYNVMLGCSHFSRLLNKFNGSLELALAAYNAGEANVSNWRKWFPRNEVDLFVDNIPLFETRNYVKRVLSNYAQYRELYGR